MIYQTRIRRAQWAPGPSSRRRKIAGDAAAWLIVLALVAMIVYLLCTPLLQPL